MSRDCERCAELQTTIDRLALELADERAERDRMERRALAWRRVARWIYEANRKG